ncbi:DNA recombination and repair protein RecO [Liberibacter crescens BT-1]|uniref:DNA repair protein RecO n=1 Tax=Liberibacter crescens (strain BT-1) TaxID=1215343 RepID=L0ET00_LIBCB|nr:DNA repair protein RecO [Liberibacter crescens]AGA64654.1 DNA recombination and repair protein RecO [Liberibacter crescens BT-1]AMC12764.1 DNA recombination protein RecO [Liberibacter crescens]
MQWQDNAIILGLRVYGEKSIILEVITSHHGRHFGLVRSGQSRFMKAVLQPGNLVSVVWRARLINSLGEFRVEMLEQRAARLMGSALSLYGLQSIILLLRLLPERDSFPEVYEMFTVIIQYLDNSKVIGKLFIQFEIAVLKNLGFGLDLTKCAVTGTKNDLVWVSPKSGCAISRTIGQAYAKKMLVLPSFLYDDKTENITAFDIEAAFRLTGYFFNRHASHQTPFDQGGVRTRFLQKLLKMF